MQGGPPWANPSDASHGKRLCLVLGTIVKPAGLRARRSREQPCSVSPPERLQHLGPRGGHSCGPAGGRAGLVPRAGGGAVGSQGHPAATRPNNAHVTVLWSTFSSVFSRAGFQAMMSPFLQTETEPCLGPRAHCLPHFWDSQQKPRPEA